MVDQSSPAANTSGRTSASAALSFVLALVAGLITWGFIHFLDPKGDGVGVFKVPKELHIRALGESAERWSAYLAAQDQVDLKNSAVIIGLLGALLGCALAVGTSPSVSLFKRIVAAVLLGTIAGAVAGIAGCWLQRYFEKSGQISVDLSAYINALLFGTLGLGLGIIVGGLSGSIKAMVNQGVTGLILGAVAGFAYPLIAYCLMASVNIEELIPKVTSARLLWLFLATSILGLMVPLGIFNDRRANSKAMNSSGI